MGQEVIWDYFQNQDPESFSQNKPRLAFILSHIKGRQKVLNIGVGNGLFEALAYEQNHEVYSVDPNKESIERLQKNLNLGQRAKVGDIQNLPFEQNLFDVVVATEVFEHLPSDVLDKGINDIKRILKPKGVLIGTVPARERLKDAIVICPNCAHTFHRWGHEATFTVKTIKEILSARFEVLQVYERSFSVPSLMSFKDRFEYYIKEILWTFKLRRIGHNIFFIAQKKS